MAYPYFCDQTLDDLMRGVIEEIQRSGDWIRASKGECKELTGVLLELTNPRARLSRTETRGKLISGLGELCWYLAETNREEFIAYYIPVYKEYAEEGIIFGGYGPRLFNWGGLDQWANVTAQLKSKPTTRKAVIQLFDAHDIEREHKDVPCTCTMQFMVRDGRLNLLVSMRSNDATLGLPHDVFAFTMLQEIMARSLSVELGTYKHVVGSLHFYRKDEDTVRRFMDEGWQSTAMSMPPMPEEDPWPSIDRLLTAEQVVRSGGDPWNIDGVKELHRYWTDIIRLLHIFRLHKDGDTDAIQDLHAQISPVYRVFIENRLTKSTSK